MLKCDFNKVSMQFRILQRAWQWHFFLLWSKLDLASILLIRYMVGDSPTMFRPEYSLSM